MQPIIAQRRRRAVKTEGTGKMPSDNFFSRLGRLWQRLIRSKAVEAARVDREQAQKEHREAIETVKKTQPPDN